MGAYSSTIASLATQNNVDPSLALAVAQAESGGQQYDASGNPLTSSAGAVGIMQLEPGTAAQYGADPSNPIENIDAGTAYLGDLLNQYGDTGTALAAYNWGPGNVSNAIAEYGTAPVSWNGQTVPAWFTHAPAETQSYVMKIMGSSSFGGAALPTAAAPLVAATGPALAMPALASAVSPAAVLPASIDSYMPWILGAAAVAGFAVILEMSNA
jgi:soluble lytic murein transglycosylase-like protein